MRTIESIKGNEIEEWASRVEQNSKLRQLDEEEMNLLISCSLYEDKIENDNSLTFDDDTIENLIRKRILYRHNYIITKAVTYVLGMLSEGIPGRAVMLCNYLQYQAKKLKVSKITMKVLSTKIFPFGVPDNNSWDEAWNNQKYISYDGFHHELNMLDNPEFAKSLRLDAPTNG